MAPNGRNLARGIVVAVVTASTLIVPVSAQATGAAPTTTVVPAVTLMDAKQDAEAMRRNAVALRRDVAGLLQQYMDTYADRFTAAELKQLMGYRGEADRQLASVTVTTGRLRAAIAQGRSAAQVERARRAALASWSRARTTADSSWEGARAIMEPKLSLFERLGALNDYNDLMGRFDALGEEIRTVGTTNR